MRIVTWNCARGPLTKKLEALHSLQPDVAVLCEAPPPDEESERVAWFPSTSPRLGIQVRAHDGYSLERLFSSTSPCCVNPVRVQGAMCFHLLAVWTWPAPTYVKAFASALEEHADFLASGMSVVAGDFNGNPVHDKPGQSVKWVDAFARLNELGLVSAYHRAHGVAYGAEPAPTHLHLRRMERPFHIDFCFVPRCWEDAGVSARVEVGFPWGTISDHYPLIVDVGRD